jgi:tetraacyldisaccharide 4'-kinase
VRRWAAALQAHWWRSDVSFAMRCLQPVAALYAALAAMHRIITKPVRATAPGCPLIVVGNLVVGGAGKTPTVIALVDWLRLEGWTPGVVSRGYGRAGDGIVEVRADTPASACGDEPLLIHRRTAAPVVVGRDRVAAAQALCSAHPEVNIVLSDDGLQHHRLARDVEVMVFDGRGAGNSLTLPAGPLRQALPSTLPEHALVLYNAPAASTALPGVIAQRHLSGAMPLQPWWQGRHEAMQSLQTLKGRPLLAAAGMGEPERFFRMLEEAGLQIMRQPLPDHASFSPLPWPASTPDVILTEKDAVKLRPGETGATRVWVAALDFGLPSEFTDALRQRLPAPPRGANPQSPQ